MKKFQLSSMLLLLSFVGLISTLGISADFTPPHGACPMPVDYEQPLIVDETPNIQRSTINKAGTFAASIIANAIALGAIVFVDSCVNPKVSPFMKDKNRFLVAFAKGAIVGLSASGIFATMKNFGLNPKEHYCLLIAILIGNR